LAFETPDFQGVCKSQNALNAASCYILLHPRVLAIRARLTVDYVEQQFNLYRRVRQKVKEYIEQIKKNGFDRIRLVGEAM